MRHTEPALPVTGTSLRFHFGRHVIGHAARERVAIEQECSGPLWLPGTTFQATVFLVHIIQHQECGDDVVIGVRREGEILVVMDFGRRTRKLLVDFAVMEFEVRADQLIDHFRHRRIFHRVLERAVEVGRIVDAAERGLLG